MRSLLPNVAAALAKGKVVRILAIGATPSLGHLGGHGHYSDQIEQILEQAVKGLDAVVVNRGVSGELAAQAARRIRNEVALTEPDLVLWQVGTNDALAYVPLDDLRSTLATTIRWLKAHHVDVVLAGLQSVSRMDQDDALSRGAGVDPHRSANRRKSSWCAPARRVRLIEQAEQSGGGLFPEEFAQTELGYACLAEYVARAIVLGTFGRSLRQPPPAPVRP